MELTFLLEDKKKAGHDLFSSEKPQDIYESELAKRREQLSIK